MATTLYSSKVRQKGMGDDVEKPFQCTKCDLRFTTNAAKNIHNKKTHRANEVFICKKCCFNTNDFQVFRKHRLDECSMKTHDCHKCNKSYSSLNKLTNHMRSHQNHNYHCEKCDFKTINAGSLQRHLTTQHPSLEDRRHFACADCNYRCATKEEIQKHISEEHALEDDDTSTIDDPIEFYDVSTLDDEIDNVFTCPLCDYLDPDANSIEMHMQKVHASELSEEINKTLSGEGQSIEDKYSNPLDDARSDMFTCPLCDHLETDAVKMEMHIRKAHEVNMPFSCTECDFECFDHKELQTHVNQEHGNDTDSELLTCTKCEFTSKSADDLENHIYDVHTRIKCELSCTLCEFTSNYNDELEKHIFDVHTTGVEQTNSKASGYTKIVSRLYREDKINRTKRNKIRKYKNNIKAHTKEFRTKTQVILQSDTRVHHKKAVNRILKPKEWIDEFYKKKGINWKCNLCDGYFLTKGGLQQHKTTKHRNLECEECDIIFRTIAGLQRHNAKEHSSNEPISCPECDFKCTNEMDLRSHISVHEPHFEFMCPVCEESYNDKADLMNHMLDMNHTGDKPHICTECKEQFLTSAALNIHMKSHNLNTQNTIEDLPYHTAENNVIGTEIGDQSVYIDNAEYINDPSSIHDLNKIDNLETVDYPDYYDDSACENDPNYVEKVGEIGNDNIPQKYTNESNSTELNQENVNEEDNAIDDVFTCPLCDYLDSDANNIEMHIHEVHASELTNESNSTELTQENANEEDNVIDDVFTCPLCDYLDSDANNIEIHMQEVHASELSEEINKNIEDRNEETNIIKNTQEAECSKDNMKVKDTKLVWGFEKNNIDSDTSLDNLGEDFEDYDEIDSNMWQNSSSRHNGYSEKRKANKSFGGPAPKKSVEVSQDDIEIDMLDEMKLGTKDTVEMENMEVLYNCNECDYVGSKHGLAAHYKIHNDVGNKEDIEDEEFLYSCSECDYLGTRNGLQVHSRVHQSNSGLFSCDKCDYKCFKAISLEKHNNRHHSMKQNVFNCSKCDFKCTSSNGMKVHIKTHAVKNPKEIKKRRIVAIPYTADSSKSSNENDVSNTHVTNGDVTKKDKGKRKIVALPMQQNTKSSEDSNDSETALSVKYKVAAPSASRESTKFAQYECKLCSYKSVNRRGVGTHMTTVHGVQNAPQVYPKGTWVGVRQYACELCDFQGANPREITAHFRVHVGDRPFGCNECGARFTQKSSLQVHEACHLEEKPYSCIYDGCNFATKLKVNLNTHYAKHRASEKKIERLKQRKEL